MSSYTAPIRIQSVFNPSNFVSSTNTSYLTKTNGDKRYLQLIGGTETGVVNFTSGITSTTIAPTGNYTTTNGNFTSTNGTVYSKNIVGTTQISSPAFVGGDYITSSLNLKNLNIGNQITAQDSSWFINSNGITANGLTSQSGTVYANKIQGTTFQSTGTSLSFASPIADKSLSLVSPVSSGRNSVVQVLNGSIAVGPSGIPSTNPATISILNYTNNKGGIVVGYCCFIVNGNGNGYPQFTSPIATVAPSTTNTTGGLGGNNAYATVAALNFTANYTPYTIYGGTNFGGISGLSGNTLNNGLGVKSNSNTIQFYCSAVACSGGSTLGGTLYYHLTIFNDGFN